MLNYKLEDGKLNGEGGLAPKTVNLIFRILNSGLKQAVKESLVPRNVCEAVETFKENKKEFSTWNKEQVKMFLKAAEESRFYPVFYIALNTGMRKGELIGLKWEDVNLKTNEINVKRQVNRTANGLDFTELKSEFSTRTIPVTKKMVSFLKSHKIKQNEKKLIAGRSYNKNNLVCCNGIGNRIHPMNLFREFKRIIKRAGVPEIRFHDLRHTFATLFLQNDGAMKTLQLLLGHSSIKITMDIYAHVTDEMRDEAAKKIAEMFR